MQKSLGTSLALQVRHKGLTTSEAAQVWRKANAGTTRRYYRLSLTLMLPPNNCTLEPSASATRSSLLQHCLIDRRALKATFNYQRLRLISVCWSRPDSAREGERAPPGRAGQPGNASRHFTAAGAAPPAQARRSGSVESTRRYKACR